MTALLLAWDSVHGGPTDGVTATLVLGCALVAALGFLLERVKR